MLDSFPIIMPCREADMEMLVKLASADGHAVIAPTFLVSKAQQVVGYVAIIPCVHIWLDTQRVKVRDSAMVSNFFENHLRAQGGQIIGVSCVESSPLRPFLPRIGYVDTGAKTFVKNLNV
jgi:hypothetical protein